MPLDIFVPFWGDPALLRETVASVLSQHNGDWRLTVVDDAYPDETVADWFAGIADPRVSYLRKPENEGITANYRTCAALAAQDLVVLLGCDDVLLPNFVDVVLNAHADFPDAAVIQPGVRVIDEHGVVAEPLADRIKQRLLRPRARAPRVLSGEPLAISLMRGNWLYWPSLTFRREVLRGTEFREGMPLIQDLAIVMDIVTAGGTLLLEPTVCFHYRRHGASASSAALLDGTRFRGERAYFALAAAQCASLGWRRAARAARLHLSSRLYALALIPRALRGRPSRARVLMRHAFARGVA